jgi:hypothetical protein
VPCLYGIIRPSRSRFARCRDLSYASMSSKLKVNRRIKLLDCEVSVARVHPRLWGAHVDDRTGVIVKIEQGCLSYRCVHI